MVDNEPLPMDRGINEGATCLHLLAGAWLIAIHHKCIEADIKG
jgi:hypothetical protein